MLTCWGSLVPDESDGVWVDVSVGSAVVAIDPGGRPACWAGEELSECWAIPGDVVLKHVASGIGCTCGVLENDELACWAADDRYAAPVREMPVGGTWASVAVGWDAACALSTDGGIECWGDNYFGFEDVPDPL